MAKKGKSSWSLGSLIILLICAIVFCGSGAYLGLYLKDNVQAQNEFKVLKNVEGNKLMEARKLNEDVVGWITIDDTKIDYPVMWTPEDEEFYLHRNFEKEYSEAGTPFVDGNCEVYGENGSWNYLIYGHNMKIGTMFHDLVKFEDEEFRNEHRFFSFDLLSEDGTEVEEGTYEIFALARGQIYDRDSTKFKYYKNIGFGDEEAFDKYVDGVCSESIYDSGIRPKYGDQLVTLSTCAYHTDEGRFYIVGVKRN